MCNLELETTFFFQVLQTTWPFSEQQAFYNIDFFQHWPLNKLFPRIT